MAGRNSFLEMSGLKDEEKDGSMIFLNTQYSGVLHMKPFYKSYFNNWHKVYIVIKDMFLIWFKKKPKNNYSINPSGFISLLGCVVSPEGRDGNGFVLKICHMDAFNGQDINLRISSGEEASILEKILVKCARVTPESSLLGQRLLANEKSKEDERLKEQKLEIARQKAVEALELNDEKQKLMEQQLKNRKKQKKILKKHQKLTKDKVQDLSLVKKDLMTKEEQFREVEAKFKDLQSKFLAAKEATEQITKAVLDSEGPNKLRILKNLQKISDIFKDENEFETEENNI